MTVLITTQPQDTSVEEGIPAFFDVVAEGTGTLTYQWYITTTGAIDGAVTNALAIGGVSMSKDGDQYYVLVTDDDGTVQSDTATLTVLPSTDCPGYACDAYNTYIQSAGVTSYYPMTNGFDGLSISDDTGGYPNGTLLYDVVGTKDLVAASVSSFFSPLATGTASCSGTAYSYTVNAEGSSWWNFGAHEWPNADKFSGTVGVVQRVDSVPPGKSFALRLGSQNGSHFCDIDQSVVQIRLYKLSTGTDPAFDVSLAGIPYNDDNFRNITVNWYPAVTTDWTTIEVYADHVLFYQEDHEGLPTGYQLDNDYYRVQIFSGGGFTQQDLFIIQGAGYDPAAFKAAWDRSHNTYVPPTGCSTAPPDPIERSALVWNFEDDNFTWMDASVDITTSLDPVVCMHYNLDPGFQTRWSDLMDLGVRWEDFIDQGTRWSDLYGGGRDQNMYWLADTGVYKSDQEVVVSGLKKYFVEKTNIDLDEALGLTSNLWKHIRQFYFHLQSNTSQVGTTANNFTFTTGWSKNLMDAPDWRTPIVINLQATTNDGRHKVDLRTTGRYLALNMDFTATSEFAMTGGDLDVEPSHGR